MPSMTFKDIYGHERQIGVLRNAIAAGRVSHAYLFFGMKGIGKRTVAEVFAKALNCREGKSDFDACGRCLSCRKADRNNHPDVITVKAEGQFIQVKEIREIQEQMTFAPFEGGKRVFIMVDADRMNNVSANALLKTLEEPSASNVLILITSRPSQLPMTILSRCQQVRFAPLRREAVISFLQERLSLDPESSYLLASSSGGSIGSALELHEEAFLTRRREILETMEEGHMKDPLMLLSFISSFGQDRGSIMKMLGVLTTGYRDALVYKETGNKDLLVNRDRFDVVQSVAQSRSGKDILNCISSVSRACSAIERNANKQLTLEMMVFRLNRYWKS
ncbi:MAG: DNA polymerase III subunit delta' [Deltaproteobacteria bacterium]|nr:DNA polymerase III subunit delta' [Deltaproteobacteria bacterium]